METITSRPEMSMADVRNAACQIRNAGLERIAPALTAINGREIVAFVKDNKAFVAIHAVQKKTSPNPVKLNPDRSPIGVTLQRVAKSQVSLMVGSEQEAGETLIQWAQRLGLTAPWLEAVYRLELEEGDSEGEKVVESTDEYGVTTYNVVKVTEAERAMKVKLVLTDIVKLENVDMKRHQVSRIPERVIELEKGDQACRTLPGHMALIPLHPEDKLLIATKKPKAELTEKDVDVEFMSYADQREFRHNHPMEYERWVEELKEEMGVHWDESLVLPPFNAKKDRKISWEEIDEDLDDMYKSHPEGKDSSA
jgi:hypothetical protein